MAKDAVYALAAGTDTLVAPENRQRKWLLAINDGAAVCYLQLQGKTAVASQGIRLNQDGGNWEINSTNPYTGEIRAISTAGTTLLVIEEDRAS